MKILFAAPDRDLLECFRKLLETDLGETVTAFDGTQVLTLLASESVDAVILDRDLPRVPGVVEGLRQYYELEQETDLWSLNTGKVMAKVGANELPLPERLPVSFAIVDNTPYRCRRAVALRQVPGARRHHLERRTSCPCGGRA